MRKGIIIIGLLLISICAIPFVIFSLQAFVLIAGNGGGGGDPPIYYDTLPSTPILDDIQPYTDTDGIINLDWSDSSRVWYYNVYRQKLFDAEQKTATAITSSSFIDSATKENTIYQYRIEAVNNKGSVWSNKEFVIIEISSALYPTNPSIIINDGAETTDSLEVTLTLYCDNANYMRFQISEVIPQTNWVSYSTTYPITLLGVADPDYPDFRVGVEFKNDYGMTGAKYDEITYEEELIPLILPSNPSISINSGAEITDSLDVILSLSCANAVEMQIQISINSISDWIPYSTIHTVTLLGVADPDYPDFRVGVIFRNDDGISENVYDEITYEESTQEEEEEEEEQQPTDGVETDYTIIYILIGVLIGLIGIGVFLKYRKQIIKSK